MGNGYPAMRRKGQLEAMEFNERERLHDRGMDRASMNGLMVRLQERLGSKNKLAEAIYGRKNAATSVKQLVDGTTRYTDALIDQVIRVAKSHGVELHETKPQDHEAAASAAPEPIAQEIADVAEVTMDETVPEPTPPETADEADTAPETGADATVLDEIASTADHLEPATAEGDEASVEAIDSGLSTNGVDETLPTVQEGEQETIMTQDITTSEHADATAPHPEIDPDREDVRGGGTSTEPPAAVDWLAGVRSRRDEHVAAIEAGMVELERIDAEIERLAARRSDETARIDGLRTGVAGIDEALAILQRT